NAVRGGGHAPDEIPASHHHRGLHTHLVNFVDFARDPGGSHRINSKALLAYQHLAAQLQQDSVVSRLGHFHTMRCRALSVPWPPSSGSACGPICARFGNSFAHFEAGKAADLDVLAEFRHLRGDQLADGQAARKVLDVSLLEEAAILVEFPELS